MSNWIKILLGGGALMAAGLAAALLLIDAEQFRPTLQAQLERALARPVTLGRLSHSILPLSLRVNDVKIGEDPAFGVGTFLSAAEVGIHVKLWPLLSKRVEIKAVELREPKVELIRRAGVWNYESVGKRQEDSAASSTPVQFGEVKITGAEVAATLDGAPRVVYPKTDLTLSGMAAGRGRASFNAVGAVAGVSGKFNGQGAWQDGAATGTVSLREGKIGKAAIGPVDAKFDLVTQSPSTTNVRLVELQLGKLAVRAEGTITDRRLDLNLDMPRAPVADLVQLAAAFGQGLPPGMQADGDVAGKLRLQGTIDEPQLTGRITASDLKLAGGAVKQEVRSRAVTIDLQPETIRSGPFEITSGRTKLSGHFSVSNYATKPVLESAVITENAEMSDLMEIARAYGAADPGLKATGKATLRLRVHGSLARGAQLTLAGKGELGGATLQSATMSTPAKVDRAEIVFPSQNEGTVSIGRLELEQLVLTAVRAKTTYRGGILRLDPLNAQLFGGTVGGQIAVDTRGANTAVTLDSHLERVESGRLIAAFSKLPEFISGPVTADINLTLAPKGNEDALRAAVGKMALKFAGGKLHTVNLLGELKTIASFIGGPKLDDRFTSFVSMQGGLELDKGVVRTEGLKFNLKDATATFTGSMNCLDQTLALKLLSVLSPELSESVGGNRIGGLLTTAVRNAAREIIIPAQVSGTFTQPRITPDAPAMARLKLQSVVPALNSDPAAVVDMIKGGKDSVQGVLDIFRGKGGAKKKE